MLVWIVVYRRRRVLEIFVKMWITVLCVFAIGLRFSDVSAVYLKGTSSSYAQYPKWNACINASISFDFRTQGGAWTNDDREELLMYVDDGGRYDFIVVTHRKRRVEVALNIVDGTDGHVEIVPDVSNVDDDNWHSVKIQRRRMETIVTVDGRDASRLSFGSDPYFGRQNNSYVYFGGIPTSFADNFRLVSLPSAYFQPRFKGEIRNVIYNNCSCASERANLLGGVGIDVASRESCDVNNPCQVGCVCISSESGSRCDCSGKSCTDGK